MYDLTIWVKPKKENWRCIGCGNVTQEQLNVLRNHYESQLKEDKIDNLRIEYKEII